MALFSGGAPGAGGFGMSRHDLPERPKPVWSQFSGKALLVESILKRLPDLRVQETPFGFPNFTKRPQQVKQLRMPPQQQPGPKQVPGA